jgi:hypothetical protein
MASNGPIGRQRKQPKDNHLFENANDTQQVTTRCIIAPYFIGGSERCCVRERHTPFLQAPAQLPADGTRFSEVPSPDRWSVLPDRPESFPAFRHECKGDAHSLSGSTLTSCVQGSSLVSGKSAAFALLWLFRCGDRLGRFSVGSMASRSFLGKIKSQTIRLDSH